MAWWRCKGCQGTPVEGDDYEKPWIGACPHCGRFCNAERVGSKMVNKNSDLTATSAASSGDTKYKIKYVPTHVEPLDLVLSGGVAVCQSILVAGSPGCRKSSIAAMALQGLTKHTERYMLYVAAEQNKAGVLGQVFGLNGVTSPQILLHANDEYENNIDSVLERCNRLRPFACVFDSLQPIAAMSGQSEEVVAKRIADYCDATKMIAIVICQLTKGGDFKGGTGASYYTSTLLLFEPFRPSIDGDPRELFGKKIATEIIGYNREMMARDGIEELRVLVGGAFGKNRYGAINQKAYIFTTKDGEMVHLPLKKKPVDEPVEEHEEHEGADDL